MLCYPLFWVKHLPEKYWDKMETHENRFLDSCIDAVCVLQGVAKPQVGVRGGRKVPRDAAARRGGVPARAFEDAAGLGVLVAQAGADFTEPFRQKFTDKNYFGEL
jgi:hypothetical protein